jgi:hypothetical protein
MHGTLWAGTAEASSRKRLEVLEISPTSPAVLNVGERVHVKVRYRSLGWREVQVWVQPWIPGRGPCDGVPDGGFFAPSESLNPQGGEIDRHVGLQKPGKIKSLRVVMVYAQNQRTVVDELLVPVNLQWRGNETTELSVDAAQKEAVRLYPQLAVADSLFNRAFVARHKVHRANKSEFLKRTDWPLALAHEIAAELNTQRTAR